MHQTLFRQTYKLSGLRPSFLLFIDGEQKSMLLKYDLYEEALPQGPNPNRNGIPSTDKKYPLHILVQGRLIHPKCQETSSRVFFAVLFSIFIFSSPLTAVNVPSF